MDSATIQPILSGSKRRIPAANWLFAAALALFVCDIAVMFPIGDLWTRGLALDIQQAVETFIAAALLLIASRAALRWDRRCGIAWGLMAAAVFSYGLANTIWLIIGSVLGLDPFPSIADVLYLTYYPLFVAGLLLLPSQRLSTAQKMQQLIDMSVVMIASVMLLWGFVVAPILAGSADATPLELAVTLAYPALDLVLLWSIGAVVFRSMGGTRHRPLLIIALSALVMVAADTSFNIQSLQDAYVRASPVDLLYSFSTLMMALAGLAQTSAARGTTRADPLRMGDHPRAAAATALRYMPYAWVGVAFAMVAWAYGRGDSDGETLLRGMAVGVAMIVALVLLRQILALRDNELLAARLQVELDVRTRAEENLRAAKEEAEGLARAANAASVAKGNFLATMSHEIRTPMNGVIGFANLLAGTPLSADQREFVQTIRNSGESLLALINDILDYSKVEAGKLTVESCVFDVRAICADVIGLVSAQAADKGLELALIAAPDPIPVLGDPGRVRQVLLNLVGNAVKFTPSGHVRVSILAHAPSSAAPGSVQIAIADTGIGIAEEQQNLLFQKFSQADGSTTRKYGGTGLGLAISKQLIELMGGQIGFKSAAGAGATFWIVLPMSESAALAPAVSPAPHPGAPMRVITIDDNALNQRVLQHILTSWQIDFAQAASAGDALRVMREAHALGRPYDVAIVDHLMPDMDGVAFVNAARADPELRDTQMILFSSALSSGDRSLLRLGDFFAVLAKPLTRPALLREALQAAHARRLSHVEGTARSPQPAPSDLQPAQAPSHGRVLLAEDNTVNQKLATRMLEKLGYHVEIASNGREVLELTAMASYDLVLMDCLMPEMDGFEASRQLREREAHSAELLRTPIIALTANAMHGDRERCLQAGMDDYISKPVKLQTLGAVLERWMPKLRVAA